MLKIFLLGAGILLSLNQYNILTDKYPRVEPKYDPFRFEYLSNKPKQNFAWESALNTSSLDQEWINVKFKENADLAAFLIRNNLQSNDLREYPNLKSNSVKIPPYYDAWSFSSKIATDSAVEYARPIPVYKVL